MVKVPPRSPATEPDVAKQKEDGKKGGSKGGRPRKKDETLPVKVPEGLVDEVQPETEPELTKSNETRDVVGKLVGVSGSYIDMASKEAVMSWVVNPRRLQRQ